jgi:nicotinate-nucleotide pyrophosphorylase (carboxylating)
VSTFTAEEADACRHLVALALREDLGPRGTYDQDVTAAHFVDPRAEGRAAFVARKPGVVAGLPAAALVCAAVDPGLHFEPMVADGSRVHAGERLATIAGKMQPLLAAERTVLNFLQQMSGIATLTRTYVDAVSGLPAKVLDTRKTIPGWRLLAKYAVRQGGGHNHRMGLFDAALVKDNHWRALPGSHDWLAWIARLRADHPGTTVEVEVETFAQLEEVLPARPDIVLLDNMDPAQMRHAVERRDKVAPGVLLEASGGINLQTIHAIALTGVDRISVGALTHSAPALDIALDYLA